MFHRRIGSYDGEQSDRHSKAMPYACKLISSKAETLQTSTIHSQKVPFDRHILRLFIEKSGEYHLKPEMSGALLLPQCLSSSSTTHTIRTLYSSTRKSGKTTLQMSFVPILQFTSGSSGVACTSDIFWTKLWTMTPPSPSDLHQPHECDFHLRNSSRLLSKRKLNRDRDECDYGIRCLCNRSICGHWYFRNKQIQPELTINKTHHRISQNFKSRGTAHFTNNYVNRDDSGDILGGIIQDRLFVKNESSCASNGLHAHSDRQRLWLENESETPCKLDIWTLFAETFEWNMQGGIHDYNHKSDPPIPNTLVISRSGLH
jgi:hypothetical protein